MREYERKNVPLQRLVWKCVNTKVLCCCTTNVRRFFPFLVYENSNTKGVRCVLLPSASSFHFWGWRKLVPCVVSNQLKRLSWESTEDQRKKWMKWLTRSEMSRIFRKDEKHIFFQQLNFNNSCLLQVFFSTQWRPLFTGTITAHFPPGTITCKINEDWIFRNLKN